MAARPDKEIEILGIGPKSAINQGLTAAVLNRPRVALYLLETRG